MALKFTKIIDEDDCIGDSLDTINASFTALDVGIQDVQSQILTVRGEVEDIVYAQEYLGTWIKSPQKDTGGTAVGSGTQGYVLKYDHNDAQNYKWKPDTNIFSGSTNVGIGTNTPLARLHIEGGSASQSLRVDSENSSSVIAVAGLSGGSLRLTRAGLVDNPTGNPYLVEFTSALSGSNNTVGGRVNVLGSYFQINTGTSQNTLSTLFLAVPVNGGRIGIGGITNPLAKLDIGAEGGTEGGEIRLRASSASLYDYTLDVTTNDFRFLRYNKDTTNLGSAISYLTLSSSGVVAIRDDVYFVDYPSNSDIRSRVGINTKTPQAILEVNGDDNGIINFRTDETTGGSTLILRKARKANTYNTTGVLSGVQSGDNVGVLRFDSYVSNKNDALGTWNPNQSLFKQTAAIGSFIESISLATSSVSADLRFYTARSTAATTGYTDGTAEALRITSRGRIGIGTGAPESMIHVSTDKSRPCILTLESDRDGDKTSSGADENVHPGVVFKQDGGIYRGYVGYYGGTADRDDCLHVRADKEILFATGTSRNPGSLYTGVAYASATTAMFITSGGKVGIGYGISESTIVNKQQILNNLDLKLYVEGDFWANKVRAQSISAANIQVDTQYTQKLDAEFIEVEDVQCKLLYLSAGNAFAKPILKNGVTTTNAEQFLGYTNSIANRHLTGCYIAFGQAGSQSDISLLRQIGSPDKYHLTLDLHDNLNGETGQAFSIRNIGGNDAVQTKLHIDTFGKIGANTGSPAATFHVVGNSSTYPALQITQTLSSSPALLIQDESNDPSPLIITNDGTLVKGCSSILPGDLAYTGIQVSSPNYAGLGLAAFGGGSVVSDLTKGYRPYLRFLRSRSTRNGQISASNTGVKLDDTLGEIDFYGDNNAGGTKQGAAIGVYADNDWSNTSNSARIAFFTTTPGSIFRSEKMRIASNGNVGIATTSPAATLHVSGQGIINANSSTSGFKITQIGSGNAFEVSDDTNDATPFVINGNGTAVLGLSAAFSATPTSRLQLLNTGSGGITLGSFGGSFNQYNAFLVDTNEISFVKSRSTKNGQISATNTGVKINDYLGSIKFYGDDNFGQIALGANIYARPDANWSYNSKPTRLSFATVGVNTSTPLERMRISNRGTVAIFGSVELGDENQDFDSNLVNSDGSPYGLWVQDDVYIGQKLYADSLYARNDIATTGTSNRNVMLINQHIKAGYYSDAGVTGAPGAGNALCINYDTLLSASAPIGSPFRAYRSRDFAVYDGKTGLIFTAYGASKLTTFEGNVIIKGTLSATNFIDNTGGNSLSGSGTTNRGDGVPIGTVSYFAAINPPPGWLVCDGSWIGKAAFPQLSAVIGTRWGGTATQFKLPDLRGQFIRGWDKKAGGIQPAGIDPDDRVFGSLQDDTYKNHRHAHDDLFGLNDDATPAIYNRVGEMEDRHSSWSSDNDKDAGNPAFFETWTYYSGSTETRPKNMALLPCIKAFDAAAYASQLAGQTGAELLSSVLSVQTALAGKLDTTDFPSYFATYKVTGADATRSIPGTDSLSLTSNAQTIFATDGSQQSYGYQILPSGVIIQWGYCYPVEIGLDTATANTRFSRNSNTLVYNSYSNNGSAYDQDYTVVFPLAFPTRCHSVITTPVHHSQSYNNVWPTQVSALARGWFRYQNGGEYFPPIFWMAIGN